MGPEEFTGTDGGYAQELFLRWQTNNPDGYVISRKGRFRGILHRVGCSHADTGGGGEPGYGEMTWKAKVCHVDRAALMDWARQEEVVVMDCADCKP